MKVFLPFFIAFFTYFISQAQVFKKCVRETSKEFVSRIIPANAQLQTLTETSAWHKNEKVLVVFYSLSETGIKNKNENVRQDLNGFVLTQTGKLKYQKTVIDSLRNYLNPKIEDVFFANADPDPEQELAVLFSFEMDPKIAKCTGKGYETYFYKKGELSKPGNKLNRVTSILNFYGCDCSCMRNHEERAQFKTQEAIKQELKRLGYGG